MDDRLKRVSRREYFAGCALTAILIQRGAPTERDRKLVLDAYAKEAWAIADAMLAPAPEAPPNG